MALKTLMLRKKIDEKKKKLEELRAQDFTGREEDLKKAIEEAQTEEEEKAVEEEIEKLEAEQAANQEQADALEKEVAQMKSDLKDLEEKQQTAPDAPAEPEERKEVKVMDMTTRGFFGLTVPEQTALFNRDEVKNYITSIRTTIRERRAINNVGLTIPEVLLPMLKQVIDRNSKLISCVTMRRIPGNGRQVIMGDMPEAVWTDCCATLNELSLGFNDIELGCWKVGGYFDVCNAILEDNDVNLASLIIEALGVSIAKALDKAIIYGKGTKMPLGIVTRLDQTAEPSDYLPTARPWVDLHTSNIKKGTGKTGIDLFKEIVKAKMTIKNDYFVNGITWVMNENTFSNLQIESMGQNAQAMIVAGINNTMPVVGGTVVQLPFIPDDNIVYGYFEAYTLGERAGNKFATSEHYRFIEDRTVFKGTARYDGTPVIPEAFGVLTTSTATPAKASSIVFPSDLANQVTPTP